MKTFISVFLLLSGLFFTSCKADEDAKPAETGLVGYWTLTKLECYCPPGTSTPNEALEFDADGNVTYYQNGQKTQVSTYELSTGAAACETDASVIIFNQDNLPSTATYTVSNNALVIDHGLCFDAPRKTYARGKSQTGE